MTQEDELFLFDQTWNNCVLNRVDFHKNIVTWYLVNHLDQVCKTQNTVRIEHWVLNAKNLSVDRIEKPEKMLSVFWLQNSKKISAIFSGIVIGAEIK